MPWVSYLIVSGATLEAQVLPLSRDIDILIECKAASGMTRTLLSLCGEHLRKD